MRWPVEYGELECYVLKWFWGMKRLENGRVVESVHQTKVEANRREMGPYKCVR